MILHIPVQINQNDSEGEKITIGKHVCYNSIDGVVVSYKIPILVTRVRFPGSAINFYSVGVRHSIN